MKHADKTFVLQAGNRFVCSWVLSSGRIVAALHYDPEPRTGGWVLHGDTFGGFRPIHVPADLAMEWASRQVLASYPNASRGSR